ncbi:MAG: pesticidal protein Cry15Aa [Anaerolineae bacterium]|nr:pesticidal protein Cry15Aa [Anaerolineae bacterium]
MLVIKRYPNRKLYDTAAKQYISLDRVAEMIRAGQEVQVVDHATGEDLTTLTLMQIIVEQEKRHSGFLPVNVLTDLVQAGGNTLAALRRGLLGPMEELRRQVDEEIARRVEKLVSLGELAEDEGKRLISRLVSLGAGPAGGDLLGELARRLQAYNLPTRSDIQALTELVDRLTAEVDELRRKQAQEQEEG